MLNSIKERVNLARELDKLELQVKKANSESGWLQKAAKDMDMIIDDDHNTKYDEKESQKYKRMADIKRKQLAQLVTKPVFPKGFSGKYPLYLVNNDSLLSEEHNSQSAINTMKNALETYKKDKSNRKKAKSLFRPKVKSVEHVATLKKKEAKDRKQAKRDSRKKHKETKSKNMF